VADTIVSASSGSPRNTAEFYGFGFANAVIREALQPLVAVGGHRRYRSTDVRELLEHDETRAEPTAA
jgi:hypothetical protein